MKKLFQPVPWSNGANLYEVNIRQYSYEGSFAAFAKHLPRLKEMGVKILWLMPITPISIVKRLGTLGSYYACSDYTSINPEFGNLYDFKALVDEVHKMDMKLIIDWVANHTGCNHTWVNAHPEYYQKDANGNFTEENNWEDVIDLDYTNRSMRTAMIEAMQYWIKTCDIDGFRCDMAHLVPLDFWEAARTACDPLKPLFWLAECDVEPYHEVFDVSYAWQWMHLSEKMIKQHGTLTEIRNLITHTPTHVKKLYFTTNHDENSWNGTEYEKYGDAAAALAVFCSTWPGMPMLYSGQELPNYKRLKFFDKDSIDWTGEKPALHEFYKTLYTIKSSNEALQDNSALHILPCGYDDNVLCYLQEKAGKCVLVILNLSAKDKLQLSIEHPLLTGEFTNAFSGLKYAFEEKESFEIMAYEYFVYIRD